MQQARTNDDESANVHPIKSGKRKNKPAAVEQTEPAIEQAPVKSAAEVGLERLHQLERVIDQLKGQSGVIEWETGMALEEIFKDDLWKGAPEEPLTFDEYVNQRFRFSPMTARNYRDIATTFTREEAAKMRVTDMRLLARVPAAARREMVDDVIANPGRPTRELAEAVKVKRIEAGLATTRHGQENTVMLSHRYALGEEITDPTHGADWIEGHDRVTKEKMRVAKFKIAGVSVIAEDCGGFLRLTVAQDQGESA